MRIKNAEIAYHRNGVSGICFYAVLFDSIEDKCRMIATLFPSANGRHDTVNGLCSVYSVTELSKNNIAFAQGNSWRGDFYEPELRKAIKQHIGV